MTQRGIHTWDLIVHYHLCPKCGKIIESREDYRYQKGAWTKQLRCPKCSTLFIARKQQPLRFGPLLGEPQPPEWEWNAPYSS
jgi:uncharacterized C2H2 Zn-finger protein